MTDNGDAQPVEFPRPPRDAADPISRGFAFLESQDLEVRERYFGEVISSAHLMPNIYGSGARRMGRELGWSLQRNMEAYAAFLFTTTAVTASKAESAELLTAFEKEGWVKEENRATAQWIIEWLGQHIDQAKKWAESSDLARKVGRLLYDATLSADLKFLFDAATLYSLPLVSLTVEPVDDDTRFEVRMTRSQVERLVEDVQEALSQLQKIRDSQRPTKDTTS